MISTPSTAPSPIPSPAPAPTVHTRVLLTWLAIFPLVSVGMLLLAPVWGDWHPILRALLLTVIVVPLAVYIVVPQLLRAHAAAIGARRRRSR